MSRDIQLKKGGRLFVKEWDPYEKDFIEQEIFPEEFMFHLYDSISLDRDVILKDVFFMIVRNLEICSLVVGCPFLEDLVTESFIEFKKDIVREGMIGLKLFWAAFVEQEDDEDDSISEQVIFYGFGDGEYSLDFIPINELTGYRIFCDETYILEFSEEQKIVTKKKFLLLDILRSIVDTLSYMGPPGIKDFVRNEIDKKGDGNLLNIEELEQKHKEEMKKSIKPCSLCGEDCRSADFNKPNNICPKCFKNIKEN